MLVLFYTDCVVDNLVGHFCPASANDYFHLCSLLSCSYIHFSSAIASLIADIVSSARPTIIINAVIDIVSPPLFKHLFHIKNIAVFAVLFVAKIFHRSVNLTL